MREEKHHEGAFELVICSGVGIVEERHGKRALVIYHSAEEAQRDGKHEKLARELFEGYAGGQRFCHEVWGDDVPTTFSCESRGCTGTCVIQVNKLNGLGWNDVADSGSIIVNPNWAYRCMCKVQPAG